MNIEYIEDLIEREKINLIDIHLENALGAYVKYDNLNLILYDNTQIKNTLKKKEIFSEELGHYYMDATYPVNTTDIILINKQEYRAKKWSYNVLIPFENLRRAILNRI